MAVKATLHVVNAMVGRCLLSRAPTLSNVTYVTVDALSRTARRRSLGVGSIRERQARGLRCQRREGKMIPSCRNLGNRLKR